MLDRIKSAIIPHLIGLSLMGLGWFISIVNVGLARGYQSTVLFTKETGFGLLLIILGAYFADIYIGIRDKFSK